jgi:putative membrane protein (TIGR04086 family)
MMDGTCAPRRSASGKAMVILASLGLQGLCYAVFATILATIQLPLWFLYVEVSGVSVLSPRAVFSYIAILVAGAFAGWSLRSKEWLYGLIVGACTHLGSIGPSIANLSRLWITLLREPDISYQAPGNPPLGIPEQWLIIVLTPVVAAATLGAAGGLLGQWLRGRKESRSRDDLQAPPEQGS